MERVKVNEVFFNMIIGDVVLSMEVEAIKA